MGRRRGNFPLPGFLSLGFRPVALLLSGRPLLLRRLASLRRPLLGTLLRLPVLWNVLLLGVLTLLLAVVLMPAVLLLVPLPTVLAGLAELPHLSGFHGLVSGLLGLLGLRLLTVLLTAPSGLPILLAGPLTGPVLLILLTLAVLLGPAHSPHLTGRLLALLSNLRPPCLDLAGLLTEPAGPTLSGLADLTCSCGLLAGLPGLLITILLAVLPALLTAELLLALLHRLLAHLLGALFDGLGDFLHRIDVVFEGLPRDVNTASLNVLAHLKPVEKHRCRGPLEFQRLFDRELDRLRDSLLTLLHRPLALLCTLLHHSLTLLHALLHSLLATFHGPALRLGDVLYRVTHSDSSSSLSVVSLVCSSVSDSPMSDSSVSWSRSVTVVPAVCSPVSLSSARSSLSVRSPMSVSVSVSRPSVCWPEVPWRLRDCRPCC